MAIVIGMVGILSRWRGGNNGWRKLAGIREGLEPSTGEAEKKFRTLLYEVPNLGYAWLPG